MSGIQIHIHHKKYIKSNSPDSFSVIDEFHLDVKRNEFICLIGPSGCGKTTLLNIVAGLDSQFQGQISINGDIRPPNIGYVFQNPRLLPWYTVRQNIELVFRDSPPAALIDDMLAKMQLEDAQSAYPQHLSLGMQRRVAIIRAFAINPELLLMDEPFVSLDAPSARQIRCLLYSLWLQQPHTVLFVTHDLREALALADRLIFVSAAPMKILADIPITISRGNRNDSAIIETFRDHLIQNFPIINTYL